KGPVIGVSIRNLTADETSRLKLKGGVLIQDVRAGGIAAQARIQPGDVVTQINNKVVNNSEDFVKAVSDLKNGSIARVSLIREGQSAIVGMRIQ
ncbi:PDZ domain-containing protein, partial [Burkholderia stagnalis]